MKQQNTLSTSRIVLQEPNKLSALERRLQPLDVFSKATLGEAYRGEFSSLGFKTVLSLVNRFLESFAFTTKLPEHQKQILASDLLDICKYDSLEDLILFFKNARQGVYGVAKKGVDANTIIGDWLPQYIESKSMLREQLLNNKKTKQTIIISDQSKTIATYKKQKEQKEAQDKANEMMSLANEATKNILDRQMLEDLIYDWRKSVELRPFVRLLIAKRKQFKK